MYSTMVNLVLWQKLVFSFDWYR